MPINPLQRLMQSASRYANMAQLEDAILVLGETGDGKSTFIGYAQGCTLRYVALPEQRLVVDHCPKGVVPPNIGMNVHSETLFPAVFRGLHALFNLVDFPGFQGNRDKETTLLEFLATQVSVKTIQSVKSVVFLMSYEKMLSESRDSHILSSLEIMANLFKELNAQSLASIQLLISHLPQIEPPSKTDIKDMLSRTQVFVRNKLAVENTILHQRMEQLLSHFIQESSNGAIVLFDPLSNSTKNELLTHVSHLTAMPTSVFQLIGTQQAQLHFLNLMKSESQQGQDTLNFLLSSAGVYDSIQANMTHFASLVHNLTIETQTLQKKLNNTIHPAEVHSSALDKLKALLNEKTLEIEKETHWKGGPYNDPSPYLEFARSIEAKNEMVLYETKEWSEKEPLKVMTTIWPSSKVSFSFNHYQDKRYVDIVREGPPYIKSNHTSIDNCRSIFGGYLGGYPGRFEHLKRNLCKGSLEITYYSPEHCRGSIRIYFYMSYNELPNVLEEIKSLKNLANLIQTRNTLIEQIANLTDSLITSQKERKLFSYQSSVNATQLAQNELLAAELALQMHYNHHHQAVQHFRGNKSSYQMIDAFNQVIGLNTTVTNTFHASYSDVLRLLNESPLALSDMPWHDAPLPFLRNIPYYVGQFAHRPHRFATHKIPARFSNQTADKLFSFDSWGWDPSPKAHPVLSNSLFTLRLFKEDKEVGSAVYYGQPEFCRSVNGERHNIIATTGLLSERTVNASAAEEICRLPIPPSFWDRVGAGALQGAIGGAVDVLGDVLEVKQVSKTTSQIIQDLFYYGAMLWMRYTEHLAEEKSSTDALKEAIVETVLMYCIHLSFKLIDYATTRCEQRSHTHLNQGFSFFSRTLKLVPLVSNLMQQKEQAAAFIATSIVTQELVRSTGRDIVDSFRSNR